MYCSTCWTDASYCPPQPDGSYLCPGCAGIQGDTAPPESEPVARHEPRHEGDPLPWVYEAHGFGARGATADAARDALLHPTPAPTLGWIQYTDGTGEPCYHLRGRHLDGSCIDCGCC